MRDQFRIISFYYKLVGKRRTVRFVNLEIFDGCLPAVHYAYLAI